MKLVLIATASAALPGCGSSVAGWSPAISGAGR